MSNQNQEYIIYYKCWNGGYNTIKNIKVRKSPAKWYEKLNADVARRYELPKGYEASSAGLALYRDDFELWCSQLKKNFVKCFDYKFYHDHKRSPLLVLNMIDKAWQHKMKDMPDAIEYRWIESCNNGGLTYFDEEAREYTGESYGYDFKGYYPENMTKIHVPVRRGDEVILGKLPKKLVLGYYRIKITSKHPHVTKVFKFSKNNVYTNYAVEFAREISKKFKLRLELVDDGQPNGYLYEKVITGERLFGEWFRVIKKLKTAFPKNGLIKNLSSGLWGRICKGNVVRLSFDQLDEYDVSMGSKTKHRILDQHANADGTEYFEVLNNNQPYTFACGRMKALLTSYGQVRMGRTIAESGSISKVIRVQTDDVVYKVHKEFDEPTLVREDKTSGLIIWVNVNKYINCDSSTFHGSWTEKEKLGLD